MNTDQAEKLRAAVRKDYMAANKVERQHNSRVIAVTSGKGGVGKTNLVLNLALKLAQMNCRVVVIDADLGLANVDILLNILPEHTLEDVISGKKEILEILLEGPQGIKIVPGGSGLFDLANLDLVRRNRLLDKLRVLERYGEIILLDTSAGISKNVIDFIRIADEFIMVTTPEPTALTDGYGMLKIIAGHNLHRSGYVVVNYTKEMLEGERTFKRLQSMVQKFLPGFEIRYLGGIGYDRAVAMAVQDFSPFLLKYPESAAAASIHNIAWRLLSNEGFQPTSQGKLSFIERLKGLFINRDYYRNSGSA
ncbi:MAG: MinD/ParA family protein [Firmicutes bacterium]|nr:MinD/ParA family protein [Bacillota bacterium]